MATEVSTVAAKFRDDFSTAELNDSIWEVKQLGPGMSIDLASTPSALKVVAGTTANSETIIRSVNSYIAPFRAMFMPLVNSLLTQRIANQEIEFRIASADGLDYASWLLDGTTSTSYKLRSGNGGVTVTDSTIASLLDSNTGAAALELELYPDECYWHQRVADSSNGRTYSGVRNRRIPNPDESLFIEIRVRNLGTAPASSTVVNLDAILLQDINELTAEITGGRGGGAASQALPVSILSNPAVNANGSEVSPRIVASATDPLSATNLGVSGLYTQPTVDLSTNTALRGTRHRPSVQHTAGLTPGVLILEESQDNFTTTKETFRCPIPSDGLMHTFDVPQHMRYYRWKFQNGATAQTLFWLSDILTRGEGPSDVDKVLTFPLTAAAGQALAGAAVFTGPTLDLGGNHQWDQVKALVRSDQVNAASGLTLQQSQDGTSWYTVSAPVNLVAGTAVVIEQPVLARYIRLVNTNGATAATAFFATLTLYSN